MICVKTGHRRKEESREIQNRPRIDESDSI